MNFVVVIVSVLGFLVVLFALVGIVSNNIIKVPPSTVAIFSGKGRSIVNQESGVKTKVGYRIVKGGSGVRIPIWERVDYLSLNIMTIPLRIQSAYTAEGVVVSVDAVANVKIGSDDFSIGNAIERFLGMPQDQIQNVIFQTLEGHLRSILGTLTIEQINNDRAAFAQRMTSESAQDLRRMGVDIDVLTVQQISDPNGYLEALGQKRTAEVKRDAEIGRAEADRDARRRSAAARQDAATAEAQAEANIAAAQRDTNVAKATYEASVLSERARSAQAGPLAEAEAQRKVVVAQQNVEQSRTEAGIAVQEMEAKRKERELEATILKQAEAERQATIITSEGSKQAAILQAEGEQQAIITRAQAQSRERELLGAGEAARVRQTGQAEADAKKALAEATRAELLAQAEGSRAKLIAEAEGKRASLLAEAEGKTQLAAALNAYGPEAIQLLMYQSFIEQLPKVVEAAALPLSQIDKLVMIDGGAGNGNGNGHNGSGGGTLGRYAGELPLIVERMTESFAAVTGIDLKKLASERLGTTIDAEGSERTVIEPTPPAAPDNGTAPAEQTTPATSAPTSDGGR